MSVLSVILLLMLLQGVPAEIDSERYLRQGLELEQQGKPEQALKLWQQAIGELDIPSVAIATEYLRMATQHELRDYYPSASSQYRWGMSGNDITSMKVNRQALKEELARLEPLVDRDEFKSWQTMLGENEPSLFKEIMQFWLRLNPRPATTYNERLVEHWERIVYAREQFTRNNEPPYGTDARGRYYVKYGEPARVDSGRVKVTRDKIQWILDQIMPPPTAGNPDPKQGNMYLMLISNRISQLFLNPSYEIWIYASPEERMTDNLILIFGHKSGGSFGRLDILEDFIPASAFSIASSGVNKYDPGIPPVPVGMVLQMIYYEHFSSIDPYFAHLYNGLMIEIFRSINRSRNSSPPETYLAGQLRQRNLNQTSHLWRHVPDEFSTEVKVLPEIPIDVYQYRLLDESNRPVFATFLESYPQDAFISDFTFNEEVMLSTPDETTESGIEQVSDEYQLTHGLHLRNEQWELLGRTRQTPPLVLDPTGDSPSSSVIIIPWEDGAITQEFYAELMNNHPDSRPRIETLFYNSLRGLGKLEIEQPEPLTVHDDELVAGDLILGYQKTEGQADDHILFNFTPAHDRRIPEGENLVIHFETYQLQVDSDGISHFEVDYEIRPRSGLFGWTRKQTDQLSITLSFANEGEQFAESLEIETVGLETGNYELDWIIRDTQSNQTHEQQLHFEVVEP